MFDFLKADVDIERNYFLIPRIAAIGAGYWPNLHRSWTSIVRFCFNTLFVGCGAFGESLYGFINIDNALPSALEAFCPSTAKTVSLFKMVVIFMNYRQFYTIIQRMHALVVQSKIEEHRLIMRRLASGATKLSFLVLLTGMLTNTFFNLVPILRMLYYYFNGIPTENILPFGVSIPFLSEYPYYPFTYICLTMSGVMTVLSFSGCDGFFLCACMYMAGLFRVLQYDICALFAELETYFTKAFTGIVLMHFISAALVLCLSLLEMILNVASVGVSTYIFLNMATTTQLYLFCYGGTYVMESSLSIADTIYEIDWYKCDPRTRKMLLFILMRSQKVKSIRVPFFTPSLVAFKAIISTAGSYVALLQTFI